MSPFVLISTDETTNISCKAQFCLIYRYIFNGNVIERFICNNDVSDDKSLSAISSLISKHIKNFANYGTKLVAQTYDGAAVTSLALNGVQSETKDQTLLFCTLLRLCPEFCFISKCAANLNL